MTERERQYCIVLGLEVCLCNSNEYSGVCVYVFSFATAPRLLSPFLKQHLLTESFRILKMLLCVLPRKLHGTPSGYGSFVGFSQWFSDLRYKLSIHDGWVAGP